MEAEPVFGGFADPSVSMGQDTETPPMKDIIPHGVPVRFVVQRPFKYGTLECKPGDDFVPNGGKFDALLLKHHCKQIRLVNGQEVIR